ncbi:MAG: T9SS C-terminal target domain-containing protein [Bacteroidetes bacterium]|nr:T9SS C-terminal target domain-containing protein [Bacteroidota bacterium]
MNLEGTQANKDGVGAVITLITSTGRQYRWYNGVDFLGQSIQPALFGLGSLSSYESIEIMWPGGAKERWEGGPANRTVTLTQGTGTTVSTSVDRLRADIAELTVYPNPAVGVVTFTLRPEYGATTPEALNNSGYPLTWTVYDTMGRQVAIVSNSPGSSHVKLETNTWAAGVYLLQVRSSSGSVKRSLPFIVASQ